jgi:hypothetical protein
MQPSAATPAPRVIRHPVVMLDDFLPETEWQAVLARVLASEPQFVASGTHDDASRALGDARFTVN